MAILFGDTADRIRKRFYCNHDHSQHIILINENISDYQLKKPIILCSIITISNNMQLPTPGDLKQKRTELVLSKANWQNVRELASL